MPREVKGERERERGDRHPSKCKFSVCLEDETNGFGLRYRLNRTLSPMIGERERDGAREGGTEGERETQRQRQRQGGREGEGERERERERGRGSERNFKGGRKLLFLLPPHERERVAEGRAGGGERGTKGPGGRESVGGRDGRGGGERQRHRERERRREREREGEKF